MTEKNYPLRPNKANQRDTPTDRPTLVLCKNWACLALSRVTNKGEAVMLIYWSSFNRNKGYFQKCIYHGENLWWDEYF